AFGGILVDEQSEARVVRGGAGLVRRGLMQTLRDAIEIREVVARAINAEERVERLAPQRRALGKAQPELLGFNGEIPFRREPGEMNFAVGPVARGPLGRMPERIEFGLGGGLARLFRSVGLIGEA